MLVNQFLENSAKHLPDKIALVCGSHRLTYQELDQRVNRFAFSLLEMGINRQERIAILLGNSVESVVSIFGILKAGAIFMILNPSIKARKLKYIIKNAGARRLISTSKKYSDIKSEINSINSLTDIILVGENEHADYSKEEPRFHKWEELNSYNSKINNLDLTHSVPPNQISASDLATIIYTSGSTGTPKGVMSSHANVFSAASSIIHYLENDQEDIVLNILPLHFDYGLYQILMAFLYGGTVVLEKSFAYPYKIAEIIEKEKITGLPIVPTIARMLFQIKNWKTVDISSVRYITNTGDVLLKSHITKLQTIFRNASIYSMYGLTECKRVSYLPPEDINNKPGSVGIPMPNVEVRIIKEDGTNAKTDEIGELLVKGPNVMQGYWNDISGTEKTFRKDPITGEIWLYSGDLFKRDKDGYLYFVSRRDEMIKINDYRVNPLEVSNLICELEDIDEAFAFGKEHRNGSRDITAVVAPIEESQFNMDRIIKHCRHHLEYFLVPNRIVFRKKLPRLSNGKIDKKRLISEIK